MSRATKTRGGRQNKGKFEGRQDRGRELSLYGVLLVGIEPLMENAKALERSHRAYMSSTDNL